MAVMGWALRRERRTYIAGEDFFFTNNLNMREGFGRIPKP
jgi:hypothetical protein